jgi:ribosomal protein S17
MLMHHSGYPGQRVHTDVVGPLTKSKSGNTIVFTIIDQFTKFFVAYPLPNQKGETLAETFVSHFCTYFGVPDALVSDNGKNFVQGIFQETVKRLQIHKNNICAYKPSSNGVVERAHLSLFNKLRCELMKSKDFKNWDKYVNFCTSAMRSTVNRTTGFTPNFLTFGKELNQPMDIAFGGPQPKLNFTLSDYVKNLVKTMSESYKIVRENVEGSLETAKNIADRKSYEEQYNVGDIVQIRATKRLKKRISAKLLPLFNGPFLIVQKINTAVYLLCNGKDLWPEHHDRIIRPDTEVFPIWLLKLRAELFRHPEKFVDANMNRIGSPYGQIRDLYGERDKNDDESLLHNVTKTSRKKSKKKNPGEGPVVVQDDSVTPLVDKNPKPFEKKAIKGHLIADLPDTSNFDILDDKITSTPISKDGKSTDLDITMPYSDLNEPINDVQISTELDITLPNGDPPESPNEAQKSTDLDIQLPLPQTPQKKPKKDIDKSPILKKYFEQISKNDPISIKDAPPIKRRSSRGRVESTKYKDYVQ